MEECLESPGRPGWGEPICRDRQPDQHFPTSTLPGLPETSGKHKIDKRMTPHYLRDAGEAQAQTGAKHDTNTEQKKTRRTPGKVCLGESPSARAPAETAERKPPAHTAHTSSVSADQK